MIKHKVFTLIIAFALLLPAFFGVSKVFAVNPSFTIGEIISDESVTILIKDAPKNREFIARMGEYDTKAINGIEVGRFDTGEGGALQATLQIPAALKGRAQISVRIDSVTGGWYYYNWFWNKKDGGTWPAPSTPPATQTTIVPPGTAQPSKTPAKIVPAISIKSAVESKSVTFSISNFPKNAEVKAFLGKMFTRGLKGTEVASFTTNENGTAEATVDIPATLANEERLAIRVESLKGGWYSYNWFWNKQGGTVVIPPSTTPPAATTPVTTTVTPDKNAPILSVLSVDPKKTVTLKVENLKPNVEFTILMGKKDTMGVKGIAVGTFNSQSNPSVQMTVNIPAELAGEEIIAVRIESTRGYYAYNWFINK